MPADLTALEIDARRLVGLDDAWASLDGLYVRVRTVDVKVTRRMVRVRVTPYSGHGAAWLPFWRLSFTSDDAMIARERIRTAIAAAGARRFT